MRVFFLIDFSSLVKFSLPSLFEYVWGSNHLRVHLC